MSLLSWLRKIFRDDTDDTRDQLCTALRNLGVDAQLAARGRVEEKIYFDPRFSYGVIDIAEGPIRWVNVTEERVMWGPGDLLDFMVYGVPDARVGPGFSEVRVKAVWHTASGEIPGLRWEGFRLRLGNCRSPQTGRVSNQRDIGQRQTWEILSVLACLGGPPGISGGNSCQS